MKAETIAFIRIKGWFYLHESRNNSLLYLVSLFSRFLSCCCHLKTLTSQRYFSRSFSSSHGYFLHLFWCRATCRRTNSTLCRWSDYADSLCNFADRTDRDEKARGDTSWNNSRASGFFLSLFYLGLFYLDFTQGSVFSQISIFIHIWNF